MRRDHHSCNSETSMSGREYVHTPSDQLDSKVRAYPRQESPSVAPQTTPNGERVRTIPEFAQTHHILLLQSTSRVRYSYGITQLACKCMYRLRTGFRERNRYAEEHSKIPFLLPSLATPGLPAGVKSIREQETMREAFTRPQADSIAVASTTSDGLHVGLQGRRT